jgi:hypothetical protein
VTKARGRWWVPDQRRARSCFIVDPQIDLRCCSIHTVGHQQPISLTRFLFADLLWIGLFMPYPLLRQS